MKMPLSSFLEKLPEIEGMDTKTCLKKIIEGTEPAISLYGKDGELLEDQVRSSGYCALSRLKEIGGRGTLKDINKGDGWGITNNMVGVIIANLLRLGEVGVIKVEEKPNAEENVYQIGNINNLTVEYQPLIPEVEQSLNSLRDSYLNVAKKKLLQNKRYDN